MKVALTITAAFIVSACAVGPDYKSPPSTSPKAWGHTTHSSAIKPFRDPWWTSFNDPELNRLINEAATANLDYKVALARVRDAREQHTITFASGLPQLSAKSTASRRFNNSAGAAQSGGATSGGGFGIGNQLINIFQMGFDAQWELDFFGGVRRALEAADATVEGEQENSRDVLVTLLGEVARNYIELRASEQKFRLAKQNLTAQREIEHLTQIRQQSGLASQLDTAQAQAQADSTEAQLPVWQTEIDRSIHAIGLLLGREPETLAIRLNSESPIPAINSEIVTGLPSELLKRRPDIRRAERNMAAANAAIGVATAELYPKINLAAFIGLQNTSIKDFTPIGKSWSTASTLTMPIFNWGKLNANIRSKKIQYEQTFLNYQSTILNAFKEVEDALAALVNEQKRYQSLKQAADANRLAVALATERYEKGLTGFTDVLLSQEAQFQSEIDLADSYAKVSSNKVALYKALGGGWETEETKQGSG